MPSCKLLRGMQGVAGGCIQGVGRPVCGGVVAKQQHDTVEREALQLNCKACIQAQCAGVQKIADSVPCRLARSVHGGLCLRRNGTSGALSLSLQLCRIPACILTAGRACLYSLPRRLFLRAPADIPPLEKKQLCVVCQLAGAPNRECPLRLGAAPAAGPRSMNRNVAPGLLQRELGLGKRPGARGLRLGGEGAKEAVFLRKVAIGAHAWVGGCQVLPPRSDLPLPRHAAGKAPGLMAGMRFEARCDVELSLPWLGPWPMVSNGLCASSPRAAGPCGVQGQPSLTCACDGRLLITPIMPRAGLPGMCTHAVVPRCVHRTQLTSCVRVLALLLLQDSRPPSSTTR